MNYRGKSVRHAETQVDSRLQQKWTTLPSENQVKDFPKPETWEIILSPARRKKKNLTLSKRLEVTIDETEGVKDEEDQEKKARPPKGRPPKGKLKKGQTK